MDSPRRWPSLLTNARYLWLGAALVAVIATVVLWAAPRLQAATGTLVVVGAGRAATSLPSSQLALRQGGSWAAVGNVEGALPAAPDQKQMLVVALAAGDYDAVRVGNEAQPLKVAIVPGQVEPLLLGVDAGHVVAGGVYAGNDDVNLGLGELAGKFVPLPPFALVDQAGHGINLSSIAGRDVVIAAFHTNCHETCPLYTALFLQLAKRSDSSVMLLEVTTDPAVDTPSTLNSYAKQVGASWTFGTGTTDQVLSFWKPFHVELAAGDAHTSTLALVDRHGYVRLVYRGVPNVGHDIPSSLVTSLSATGLSELGSGGDGWGAPDVLQALLTIAGAESSSSSVGQKAVTFTLATTEGGRASLGDFAGKPVVINFWATYCPPCRAEMPLLQKDVSPAKATLLLIDEGESAPSVRAFLASIGVSRPSLLDGDLSVGRAYGASALPVTVFVRADGTVDRRQIGEISEGVLTSELSLLASQ